MPIAGMPPKEVVHTELHKFKHGQLHSGSHQGPLVKNRKQAIAIALSESRKDRALGGASPMPPMAGLGQPMMGRPAIPSQIAQSGQPGLASKPMVPNSLASPYTPTTSSPTGRDMGGDIMPSPKNFMRAEERNLVGGSSHMLHSGPIKSAVPGRTDRHNTKVASGSYVLPADAVSHIGQNNTQAGHAILNHMFGGGPYGTAAPKMGHGAGPPHAAKAASIPQPHIPKFGLQSAGGGKDGNTGEPVDVVVAGGEYTIPPEVVANIGGGDIKRGHRILDKWVMSLRQKHIATLKGLPPPVKS